MSVIFGVITFSVAFLWTAVMFIPVFLLAVLKMIIPHAGWRVTMTKPLIGVSEFWIRGLQALFGRLTTWEIHGAENLRRDKNYLLISNHQNDMDILTMLYVFGNKTPMFRFLMKQALAFIPFIGFGCWALDFPMLKRYSTQELMKHPKKRDADFRTIQRCCEGYKSSPATVTIYPEGTRFTPKKHDSQQSPYTHLLKPKSGGLGLIFGAMGDTLDGVLDATIVFPDNVGFWKFFCGKMGKIIVHIDELPVPEQFRGKDYQTDKVYKSAVKAWIHNRWMVKDALLEQYNCSK